MDLTLFWLASMAKQQAWVEALEKVSQKATINSLAKEAKSFKKMANTRDQDVRGNANRLFGLPVTQEINTPVSSESR